MTATADLSRFTSATDTHGWVEVQHHDDLVERHHVSRWLLDADPVDLRMLARCAAPTVDVGCGPGRLAAALARRGVPTLGIDICPEAVRRTRARAVAALLRDVFDPLPGEGRWAWAVLADGNIGIGGDPTRLLRRLRSVVAPEGDVIVELNPTDVDHQGISRVRQPGGEVGAGFAWAVVGSRALATAAGEAGWRVGEEWQDGGRRFAVLRGIALRHG